MKDHDGNLTTYEGVPLVEVLKSAGAPVGEKLRGATMASYVLAEAKDGTGLFSPCPNWTRLLPIPRCWSRTPRTESRSPMANGRFESWRRRRNVLPAGFVCCNE